MRFDLLLDSLSYLILEVLTEDLHAKLNQRPSGNLQSKQIFWFCFVNIFVDHGV